LHNRSLWNGDLYSDHERCDGAGSSRNHCFRDNTSKPAG
jgi:hypothetical protein